MTPETLVTLFGLACLGLGSVAMLVRWLLGNRRSIARVGRQLVEDVQRGEGFTFHRQLGKRWPAMVQAAHEQKQADLLARLERLEQWSEQVNREMFDLQLASPSGAAGLLPRIEAIEDALQEVLAVRPNLPTPTADGVGTPDGPDGRTTDEARRDTLIRTLARQGIPRDGIREAVKAVGYSIGNDTLSKLMQEAK